MAAGPFKFYLLGLKNCLNGNIDFLTDTIKAALLTSSHTLDLTADDAWDDVSTDECADGDYAQVTLSSKAISTSGGVVTIDAADVDYGSAVTITAKYLVFYKDSGVASTSYLIGAIDLDEATTNDVSSTAAPFKIRFSSYGFVNLLP